MLPEHVKKIEELYRRWAKACELLGYDAEIEYFLEEIEQMVKEVEQEL